MSGFFGGSSWKGPVFGLSSELGSGGVERSGGEATSGLGIIAVDRILVGNRIRRAS